MTFLRIQASACLFEDGRILTGIRHWSPDMYYNAGYNVHTHEIFDVARASHFFDFKDSPATTLDVSKPHTQGFLTTDLTFVDRSEAWVIARKNDQIIYSVRGEELLNLPLTGTLFSENLW
jgi:hypothetical protein